MNFSLKFGDYAVMAAYLVALVSIGYFSSSDKKDSKGFLLGGGKMPVVALAISCFMAAMSAFSLVMVPGEIVNHGLSFWMLGFIGPIITILTAFIFLRFYFKLGAFTPFEYIEKRFSPGVRTLLASLTIYVRIVYLGMVLFSTSKILEGAAGWPAWLTILGCGTFAIIFTSLGGLKAMVWTDVMQFVVLVGGLFCILGVLFCKVDGGLFGGITYAFKHEHGADLFFKPDFYKISPYVRLSFWLLLSGQMMGAVASVGTDQMNVQRLLASGSFKSAVKTQAINSMLQIPITAILMTIGLLTFSYFHQRPEIAYKSGDTALFQFISSEMPSPLPGLVIAGMMAAVISTLNAVFNSMAAIYVKEIHLRIINKSLPEKRQVQFIQIATIVIGVLACSLGLFISYASKQLAQSVVEAQTLFSVFDAISTPTFIFAVMSRRSSSLMVWTIGGLLWGLKFGMITWYYASTRAMVLYKPGMDFGYAGPVQCNWLWYVLGAGAVLMLVWAHMHRKSIYGSTVVMILSCMALGYGTAILLWRIISNIYCQDAPHAISFQWLGFPILVCWIGIGAAWMTFGKLPPKEKYEGLTLHG